MSIFADLVSLTELKYSVDPDEMANKAFSSGFTLFAKHVSYRLMAENGFAPPP